MSAASDDSGGRRRVVITGLGAVSALGVGAQLLHDRWAAGELGIADGVGACREFDPAERMSAKEVRRSDRFAQLAIAAGEEAIEQAELTSSYDPARIGCIIGTGIGGLGTFETQLEAMHDRGPRSLSPLGIPLLMPNAAAANLAMRQGLHGPAFGIVSACAAGANAIGTGLRMIQHGEVEAVVVGGAEATLTPFAASSFERMGTTSPSGISRPFDIRRDGFVMGEGSGAMVLEAEDGARSRGATILGRILAYATTVDAYHLTAPEPEGRYAAAAMVGALADAALEPRDIDYINAHGTSTGLNDRAEARALEIALGARANEIPISSTKSTIGHLLGAAGAVEAVATLLALRAHIAPPNLGFEERDPEIGLAVVAGQAQPLPDGEELVALSNSFGFGGHNAVLCLAAAPVSG
jgi:3-oxoacyl-[acyl-carrier-protein] synthase II